MNQEIEDKLNEIVLRIKKLNERIDALIASIGEGE